MVRREIKNFEMVIDDQKYPCQVPCSVHSVLTKAGADVNSVGDTVRFNAEIYVDDVALAMKNMYIRLRGIRVPARVYFADRLVAKTDGKRPIYNIDIAGLSEKGNNLLSICFDSEDCNLIYAGLSMSVEILRFSSAIIDKVNLVQKHEEGGVTLGIDLNLIGNPDSVRAVATLVSSSGQIYYAGLTKGKGSILVRDPLYWWPKGLGVQNLYRLTVNLYGESDIEDTAEIRIGLLAVYLIAYVDVVVGFCLNVADFDLIFNGLTLSGACKIVNYTASECDYTYYRYNSYNYQKVDEIELESEFLFCVVFHFTTPYSTVRIATQYALPT